MNSLSLSLSIYIYIYILYELSLYIYIYILYDLSILYGRSILVFPWVSSYYFTDLLVFGCELSLEFPSQNFRNQTVFPQLQNCGPKLQAARL